MEIKQALKNFGLSESEIKMYLAGLKVGESSLAEIAKEAGIKRGSAYLLAKNLEEKGLVGSFKMRSGLKFVASPPSALKDQARRREDEICNIVPQLETIVKGSSSRPSITVYKGKEGYLSVFEDSIRVASVSIRAIGSLKKFYDIITYEYDDKYYIPERVKKRIRLKGLYFKDEVEKQFPKERDARELRQTKFLPNRYYQTSFTYIYRDTVVFFTSIKELIAVKIVSNDIAKSEKAKFDLMWSLVN
ncbi:hypothetical protein KAJ89_01165 [Candidatus Parcubacteria bacterium]|nr:hypothetical protein [Candidatus Parcubacteria bacterium]